MLNLIIQLIIGIFSLLPDIVRLISQLNNLSSTLKSDSKNNEKQEKQDTVLQEQQLPTIQEQKEQQLTNIQEQKLDHSKLYLYENKSFYKIFCKDNDFESIPENLKSLDPEKFKMQFTDICKNPINLYYKKFGENKTASNVQLPSESPETKSYEPPTSNNRTVTEADRNKQKNILINKIHFIINKYGNADSFNSLPEEIKTLNPEEFKDYAKKAFGK